MDTTTTGSRKASHYFRPENANRGSMENVAACCGQPESDHPAFTEGEVVTGKLTRKLTTLKGRVLPKGTVLSGLVREGYDASFVISRSRWGTNVLGQFAELEKAVIDWKHGRMPGYLIPDLDGVRTGIPAHYIDDLTGVKAVR